jgi:hypothetical protein
MAKNEKNTITIDNVEYNVDELSNEQKIIVNHLLDLDRKIGSSQFNLDQLQVGKNAFMQLFKNTLNTEENTDGDNSSDS